MYFLFLEAGRAAPFATYRFVLGSLCLLGHPYTEEVRTATPSRAVLGSFLNPSVYQEGPHCISLNFTANIPGH
jgi:hypothetical protein